MPQTHITLHLPVHRRHALEQQLEKRVADETYDANIGGYVDFLQRAARDAGMQLHTDQRDWETEFSIDELDHEAKKRAHRWIEAQPGIWDWIT